MRETAPAATARLTWAWKRRQGDLALLLVDRLVGSGQSVVDIGANWGLYTARFARLVGPTGQVDAFEPHPAHARTLSALARRRPQVRVHLHALSDRSGTADLHVPVFAGEPVSALATLEPRGASAGEEVVSVGVRRLDDAVRTLRPPAFVKCDVEGLELRVLGGAETTLRAARPALLIEIEQRHQARPVQETFDFLAARGYGGWFLGPGGLRPLEEFDLERDQLRHLGSVVVAHEMPAEYVADFLFLPDGAPPVL